MMQQHPSKETVQEACTSILCHFLDIGGEEAIEVLMSFGAVEHALKTLAHYPNHVALHRAWMKMIHKLCSTRPLALSQVLGYSPIVLKPPQESSYLSSSIPPPPPPELIREHPDLVGVSWDTLWERPGTIPEVCTPRDGSLEVMFPILEVIPEPQREDSKKSVNPMVWENEDEVEGIGLELDIDALVKNQHTPQSPRGVRWEQESERDSYAAPPHEGTEILFEILNRFPHDMEIQVPGLELVRMLVQGSPEQKGHFLEMGADFLAFKVLKRYHGLEEQYAACGCLEILIARSDPFHPHLPGGVGHVSWLTSHSAYDLVVRALEQHSDNPELTSRACRLMAKIVGGEGALRADKGLFTALQGPLTKFEGFGELLRAETLERAVSRASIDLGRRSIATLGLQLLSRLQEQHPEDCAVQEAVVLALVAIAESGARGSWRRLVNRKVHLDLLKLMRQYPMALELLEGGLSLLAGMLRDSEALRKELVPLGIVDLLLSTMAGCPKSGPLQVAAARLVTELAKDEGLWHLLVESGTIRLLLLGIGNFKGHQALTRILAASLVSLGPGNEVVKAKMLKAHAFPILAGELYAQAAVTCDIPDGNSVVLVTALAEDLAKRQELLSLGAMPSIMKIMRSVEDANLHQHILTLVVQLARDGVDATTLGGGSNVWEMVLLSMKDHVEDVQVQNLGLQVLELLAARGSELRDCLVEGGAVERVTAAMKAHRSPKSAAAIVQPRALFCLQHLVRGCLPAVARVLAEKGVREVLKTTAAAASEPTVQQVALAVLHFMLPENQGVAKAVVDDGGIELAIKALTDFQQDEAVQEHGMAVLANLPWDTEKNKNIIEKSNVLELVLLATQTFQSNAGVSAFGCAALQSIACGCDALREKIISLDAVKVVFRVMGDHLTAVSVQAHGCAALQTLAMAGPLVRRQMLDMGVVKHVEALVHHDAVRLKELAQMLLSTLDAEDQRVKEEQRVHVDQAVPAWMQNKLKGKAAAAHTGAH